MPPTYLGTAEIALALGQSQREIQRACRDGSIPAIRVGGAYLVEASWLASCRDRDTTADDARDLAIAREMRAIREEIAALRALVEAAFCRDRDITCSTARPESGD